MLAADRRRKAPREVWRPYNGGQPAAVTGSTETGLQARGFQGMLQATVMLGGKGGSP